MEHWTIVDGPLVFDEIAGRDTDGGWAYTVERNSERRIVSVPVAGGRAGSNELPDECRRAVQTRGRSAVEGVLDRDTPPRYIGVTSSGLREEAA